MPGASHCHGIGDGIGEKTLYIYMHGIGHGIPRANRHTALKQFSQDPIYPL